MSAIAIVRKSDLLRMASVAKKTGMRVEIIVDGKIIRVAPDIPDNHKTTTDTLPDDFAL